MAAQPAEQTHHFRARQLAAEGSFRRVISAIFAHPGLEIDVGDGAFGRSVLGPAEEVAADQFEGIEIALGNESTARGKDVSIAAAGLAAHKEARGCISTRSSRARVMAT
jgi:hypothetical protein